MKALLNIDYTNDFVASDGKLTCGKPGQELEDFVVMLTKDFIHEGHLVVFSIDNHKKGDKFHPENKLFPPHNVEGTDGRVLYGELNDVYQINKNKDNVIWQDKTRYSAFTGTELELKLRERGIKELHIVGVCTDICVLHTAIDAYNKGFDIVIYEAGVASFNQAGHEWALGHFENTLGAEIVRKLNKVKVDDLLNKVDDLTVEATNKVRLGEPRNKLEEAHLAFIEVGGGFYRCNKDRSGMLDERLYTADEVRDYFKSNKKVLIQIKHRMNQFGEYTFSPVSNFDSAFGR